MQNKRISMYQALLLCSFFYGISSGATINQVHYTTQSIGYFDEEFSIYSGATHVGYLCVKKFYSFAVLYNFYVYPACRRQGFGQELLMHTLGDLKARGFSKIFIQPGPYELSDSAFKKNNLREKVASLVRLYSRVF